MKVNKTFRIDKKLLNQIKKEAKKKNISQISIVENALRKELNINASMGLIRVC